MTHIKHYSGPAVPIKLARETGRGSDYFGPCDCCGKPGADFVALVRATRIDGRVIGPNPTTYGHRHCIAARLES